MEYIGRKSSKVVHILDKSDKGIDSYCRMYSTGGLNKRKYSIVQKGDRRICQMCGNVYREITGVDPNDDPFLLMRTGT